MLIEYHLTLSLNWISAFFTSRSFDFVLEFIVFQEDELNDAILVVLANKQDMEGCMSVAEVHQALGLEALKNRTFQVISYRRQFFRHNFPNLLQFENFLFLRYLKRRPQRVKVWTKQWIGYRMHCRRANSIFNIII